MKLETLQSIPRRVLNVEGTEAASAQNRTALSDSESIDELLKLARLDETRVEVRTEGGETLAGKFVRGSKQNESVEISVRDTRRLKKDHFVLVSLEIFREFYAFRTRVRQFSDSSVTLERPKEISKLHQRELDRSTVPEGQEIPIRIREVTGRRKFEGKVVDLSPKGLGLRIEGNERDGLKRILEAEQDLLVTPEIPGLSHLETVPAKVSHWREVDENTIQLGISCAIPIALGDQHSLEDFLLERKYPNVVRARSDADYREVWRLINLAFQTLTPADISKTESSIVTWKKASWSPRPLNRIYLLKDQESESAQAYATISVSRFYHRTWLVHQLAVDRAKAQVLTHPLYASVVDYLRQGEDVRFFTGCWPKESRIFQRYYVDFIRGDLDQESHYLEETSIFEFPVTEALAGLVGEKTASRIGVRPFEQRYQKDVLKELHRRFPAIFLEALDLEEFNLQLADVSSQYEKVALRRQRKIFIATHGNHFVGFAIAEIGSEDQNVFSLFDNFRVFTVPGLEPELDGDAKKQLFKAALYFYGKAKVARAILWTKDTDILDLCPSAQKFHDAYLWVARAGRMKAFLRHLDRIHGRISTVKGARSRMLASNSEDSIQMESRPGRER